MNSKDSRLLIYMNYFSLYIVKNHTDTCIGHITYRLNHCHMVQNLVLQFLYKFSLNFPDLINHHSPLNCTEFLTGALHD